MSNAMALAGEYSPKRRRVSLMMWVSCGFTAGAMLGGVVSAALIPLGRMARRCSSSAARSRW